ncbi:hemicentin-2-like [Anneissia japonica]|uniref:hemicentin-2-like n=1 Tax=Anneissia japonica TaxID=1529436 RepID=UPI0014259432|nr:hemicentin-2-like [Anneissia japonica]
MFLVTRSQLVITSDQVAEEGDDYVAIACDYSQDTKPRFIIWNEVNKARYTLVDDVKTVNGRYSLRTTPGNAELIITKPVRNDTNRRFVCEIRTRKGKYIRSNPSILKVYYLDQPVLTASKSRVHEGESVILTCIKQDGDPVPSITWYKDGQALSCTTDTSRCTTSEDALKIYIEAATATDGGRYICKAESDQYRGEDGKTSNQFDLKVIHLTITFESEAGSATCIAKGHPKPSSVMIYNDGKMIDKGELIASVKINEDFFFK